MNELIELGFNKCKKSCGFSDQCKQKSRVWHKEIYIWKGERNDATSNVCQMKCPETKFTFKMSQQKMSMDKNVWIFCMEKNVYDTLGEILSSRHFIWQAF